MVIEALKIMTFIDGVNDTPFYDVDNPITLTEYNYSAGRMGMPSLTATLNYKVCLDKFWTKKEYVTFRGEKYFIFNTPSSSKDNTDTRFVHNIQFFPERYVLANTYYYDAVGDGTIDDKYQSNSTKVIFYGNIQEFAQRLNASLAYSKIGYSVVVDEGVTSEEKQISFEDKYIFEVLQEIFNIYELPFYFVGKEIHIGFTSNAVTHPFQYGFNNELLSIKKNNINQQIITRCTAVGSSDNIPFYYPNASNNREEVEASGKKWITPSGNLMPPIYRESEGAERFYNAVNDTYKDPVTGLFYEFENEYTNLNPREGKTTFEYIKPTIKGITNAFGQRIDTVLDVAFDTNDNDEINEETGEYLHPYFFIKLRKFDGEWGFNLFEHAITDNNNMTISMTSGQCGACNFEIMVEETIRDGKEVFLNTVQVDDYGNLLRDSDGNVLFGSAKPRQQNTMTNEVWIALKKDIDTYGTIMPSQQQKLTVKPNDSFVILYIELPQAYIDKAENDLKEALIKYMVDNNAEKYNFSINISRIFLAQNPLIAQELNENARIQIIYDEKPIELYISQYTYNVNEGESLPEITLELQDKITVRTSSIQRAIDAVQQDIMNSIGSIDFLKLGLRYFLRKDVDDIANGKITFKKGVVTNMLQSNNFVAGLLGSGVKLHVDEGGVSHLEIDNIDVRRKATFNELIINQAQYEGGEYIYSRAGIECSAVEDMDGFYRCYFDTKNGQVKNLFKKDDQARSQRFDETSKYYWRLVLSVGNDYIDLSKTDADSGSGIPEVGDNIIQLGNRTDKTRQSAIIVSAKKGGYISILSNISSYDLTDKNFVSFGTDAETGKAYFNLYGDAYIGNRSNTSYLKVKENGLVELKGKLEVGSSGLENLEEWSEKQDQINNAQSAANEAKATAEKAQTDAATAQSAAESAQATADLAQKETEAINEEIGKINDDNLVSPSEKTALKQQLADIKTEYAEILKQAQKYSVSSTAYTTAYNKALSALNKYTSELEKYIPIEDDYADISAYYTSRQTILEDIATAAKKIADDAQKAADDAMEAAGTAQDTANNAQQTANDALQKAQDAKDYIDNTLPTEIAEINRKLDGVVENWFYPYTPTLENEPAKTWITDGEQEKHIGDTFTNTEPFVNNETTPDSGKSWRWSKSETGVYSWNQIADSDAVKALLEASKAKETADGKSRTFLTQPTTPYSVGDLWVQGSKGDIMRCIKSRDKDAFDASDWDKASKYTDDTLAQEAKDAADAAQKAADDAQKDADAANTEIGKIKDDGVISPVEKTSLRQQQKDIQSEYNDIIAQATKYSVDKTAYTTAYNSANTALTKYTASSPEYITVGTDFNNIAAYYTARQTILEAISDAAKQYVDDIEQGSRNLIAKKYMMEWNRINAKIVLSIDEDEYGKYYAVDHSLLYRSTSEGKDNIFPQIKYEENQQYVLSVKWKRQESSNYAGLALYVIYTDGTNSYLQVGANQVTTVTNHLITTKGKTISKITATYGSSGITCIYEIQLTKGNKILNDWIVAPEDAEFTEGVNLVSNKVENWEQGSLNQNLAVGATWKQLFYSSTKYIRLINPIAVKDVITISSTAKYKFGIAQLDENGLYLGINSYPSVKNEKFTYYLNESCRQIGIIVGKVDASEITVAELSDVHLQVEQGNVASGFKPSPQDVQGEIDGIDPGTVNLINNRHNIITNTADSPEFTQYSSEVNSKGEREVKIECIKASTSINYKSRYTYLHGYLSEKVYPGFYVFSFDYKSNHDSAAVTISERASGNTNIIQYTTYLDNSNEEWKRGFIICDWTGLTNQESLLFFISPKINALGNYVAYRNLKLVRGNRGWDDSSSPSDTANDITNGIHVGGRNLLKKSNVRKENTSYRTAEYYITEKITEGTEYTISIKGQLGEGKQQWGVYNSGGNVNLINLYESNKDSKGIYKGTFKGKLYGANDQLFVYAMPSSATSTSVIEWIKLEYGNKATDWSPAPEDVQQNIDDAIDGLNDTINGTFKDGIIEEAEAIAIAKYLNQVNESFDSVAAEYAVVYASPYLEGTPKTALKTAYDTLVTKKNTLIDEINTAIQDGKATVAEKTAVDNAFADYNTAMKSYKTAYENAQKAISDKLKSYSDNASKAAQDAADAAASAEEKASEAATAIAEMNSDTIFSIVEKQTIRTQWESISGVSDTTSEPTDKGSYKIAYNQATSAGVNPSKLTSYFSALKGQLNTYKLYTNENTTGFSRTTLSDRFAIYYNTERELLKSVADKLVQSTDDKAKEDFAKSLGYGSWAEWQSAIGTDKSKTIIENGYIRTSLIKTDTLVAENVKTAQTGERIEITKESNAMKAYDSNNKEVLSVIGGNSETDLVAASSKLISQPTSSISISQGNNKTYTADIVTNLLGTQIGLLPKVMISLKSTVVLTNVKVGLIITSGVQSQYLCQATKAEIRNDKRTAFTMECDPIKLNPQASTKIQLEIIYSSLSTLGTLSYSCKWSGKTYIDLYNQHNVTEFSADGIVLASGASYYQMKRDNGIISINSRNTRENTDGYILSGSYDPDRGITFADGDNFSTDEDPAAVGGGSVIVSHNIGTTSYTVVATPYSKVSGGSATAAICVVQNKTASSFIVNTYTLPNGARSASPFEFVIYGKRV